MNARLRDKQAAYLQAMGRTAQAEDPRGANVVEMRAPGAADSDEVTVTYDNPRRVWVIRAKTTRRILADICRELGRAPAQLIATATRQGDHHTAWIKANDGPDVGAEGGQRLAYVTGLTPTAINIVLGHPIERVEQVPGKHKNFSRFLPMGSSQAKAAQAAARQAAGLPPAELEPTPADDAVEPEPSPEPDLSGDDE